MHFINVFLCCIDSYKPQNFSLYWNFRSFSEIEGTAQRMGGYRDLCKVIVDQLRPAIEIEASTLIEFMQRHSADGAYLLH
jgi:hypothetical protein